MERTHLRITPEGDIFVADVDGLIAEMERQLIISHAKNEVTPLYIENGFYTYRDCISDYVSDVLGIKDPNIEGVIKAITSKGIILVDEENTDWKQEIMKYIRNPKSWHTIPKGSTYKTSIRVSLELDEYRKVVKEGRYNGRKVMSSSYSSMDGNITCTISYTDTVVAEKDLVLLISDEQPTTDYLKDLEMEEDFDPSYFKDGICIPSRGDEPFVVLY